MNLTLTTAPKSTTELLIEFINELINCLKVAKKSKVTVISTEQPVNLTGLSGCFKIRKDRKAFEILVNNFLKDFDKLSEKQQAGIEIHFYNAINKMEKLIPVADSDVGKNKFSFICRFHRRELHRTLKTFRSSQKVMSDILYPDKSPNIVSNPDEYQKLVDFWGDLVD